MELFALDVPAARSFVNTVRQATDRQDRARWLVIYEKIHAFRPRSSLAFRTQQADPSYTQVSWYTNITSGGKDLSPDDIPSFDDARVKWILRQLVLGAAEYVFPGRMERFSATFCNVLPEQGAIHTPAEREEFEMYQNELFCAAADRIPADFSFLTGDPRQSYLSPADVGRFAEIERSAAFLANAAERVGGTMGHELLRLRSFVDFVETEGFAIDFNEPAT